MSSSDEYESANSADEEAGVVVENWYKCRKCGKKFKDSAKMDEHKKVHKREKAKRKQGQRSGRESSPATTITLFELITNTPPEGAQTSRAPGGKRKGPGDGPGPKKPRKRISKKNYNQNVVFIKGGSG